MGLPAIHRVVTGHDGADDPAIAAALARRG